jgi:hypothetical protein
MYGAKKEQLKVVHSKLASAIEKRFKINLFDYGVYMSSFTTLWLPSFISTKAIA